MTHSMRRWTQDSLGRAHLRQADAPMPVPGAGEVLIKVAAVSLNYRDRMMIDNGFGHGEPGMPLAQAFTAGSDMVGEVVAVGEGVTRFGLASRVISVFAGGWIDGEWPGAGPAIQTLGGLKTVGTLSEYVVLPEEWLVAAPSTLDDAQASTLTCAGLTAWMALVESGGLRAGQTVVVQGTGSVALFALQIAVAVGAEVIVVTSSEDKIVRAKALGATHAISRTTTSEWAAAVRELTGGRGADHVLEVVGGDNLARSLDALAPGGTVSLVGFLDSFESRLPTGPMIMKRARIQGQMVGHRRALEDLVRAIDRDGIKPVVAEQFDFDALPAALERLEAGAFGKIVVRVGEARA